MVSDCHVLWASKWSPRTTRLLTRSGARHSPQKIIRGTADGFLLALEAKDGHLLWSKQIADSKEGYFIKHAAASAR